MGAALVAIDWGTTSARAYRVDAAGAIAEERHAPLGISAVRERAFADALATLLGDWAHERVPRLACGMIGSRQGWIDAPYVECPAGVDALARSVVRTPGGELAIVPGVACRDDAGIPDVMRGEETQIAGATGAGEERVLAVLPGTHSKWARVVRGSIVEFRTFMTGEVYAVMLAHSILGRMAGRAPATGGAAFDRGVERGLRSSGLLHHLFGARTLALAGDLSGEEAADWLSGILIGSELRSARTWAQHGGDDASRVRLIGADALTVRYARALAHAGIDAESAAPGAAARGLFAIARRARLID
jgi:2-dehydro-3-deoxygalactonokinase